MFKLPKRLSQNNVEKMIDSPDKRTQCFFVLQNGEVFYRATRDGKNLIGLSKLGFIVCGEESFGQNLKLAISYSLMIDISNHIIPYRKM